MNRIAYGSVAPHVRNALLALEEQVRASELERSLVNLVYLRVSHLNGCAFCIDMHGRDLAAGGENAQRIALVSVWREVPTFYTPRERTALAWAEAVTDIQKGAPSDALYEEARVELGEKGLAELNLAVASINMWNRFGVTFHMQPGRRA